MDASTYAADAVLRDGRRLHLRAIRPGDKQALQEGFRRLSPEAVFFRFLGPKGELSEKDLRYFTEVDFRNHVALVAVLDGGEAAPEHPIGVGRYVVTSTAPLRAEVALAVDEEHRELGVGTLLLKHLARIAKAQGVTAFEATMHPENDRMQAVLDYGGFPVHEEVEDNLVYIVVDLTAGAPDAE